MPFGQDREEALDFRQSREQQARRLIMRHIKIQLSGIDTKPVRFRKRKRVLLVTRLRLVTHNVRASASFTGKAPGIIFTDSSIN